MTTPKLGTAGIHTKLRKHYLKSDGANQDWNGGIFVEEVGINGGAMANENRRCDAIYVGFTSASGRLLVGHEVKSSRSDWLAELKKIGKADFWYDNCHKWFLVVDDLAIVQDGELPDGWGLMLATERGIKTVEGCEVRRVTPSWTAVRSILSRFDTERVALIAKAVEKERVRRDAEIAKFREEFRGVGHSTPQQQLVDEVIRKAKDALGSEGSYITLDADLAASVLADATMVQRATAQARQDLERAIAAGRREAQQLARVFDTSYGPLGRVLKELSQ